MSHLRACLQRTATLAVIALWGGPATAQRVLLPSQPGDLVPASLAAAPPVEHHVSRVPLSAGWTLDPQAPLDAQISPPRATSRRFWVVVSAAELRQGMSLPITAPGALVRLAPTEEGTRVPALGELVLVDPMGHEHRGSEAFELLIDEEDMAPAPFRAGSAAFRLDRDLPTGTWHLRAPGLAGQGLYELHVFERDSPLLLQVDAERAVVFDGQEMKMTARVVAESSLIGQVRIDGLVAQLRSPAGQLSALELARSADGRSFAGLACA